MKRILFYLSFILSCTAPIDPFPTCEESDLSLSVIQVSHAECGLPNGKIEVIASGGLGNKKYYLDSGYSQNSGIFHSLRPGFHTINTIDSLYCVRSIQVHIMSGISFTNEVWPILRRSCAVATCHDGSGSISFNVFENIRKSAEDIKGLTQARIMPKEGTLSNDEIEKISCWVDDGALNN